MDLPAIARSAARLAQPVMALPTLQVRPTMALSLLRMQLILCNVRSIPALLSSPNSPTWPFKVRFKHNVPCAGCSTLMRQQASAVVCALHVPQTFRDALCLVRLGDQGCRSSWRAPVQLPRPGLPG